MKSVGALAVFTVSFNTLLFLFRIYGVFHQERLVTCVFTFLWICTVGAAVTAPFALSATQIGTTHYCIFDRVKPYGSAGLVASASYDTLVLLAITFKLLMDSPEAGFLAKLKMAFGGRGMGRIAKAVMQSGQQYYMYVRMHCVSIVCTFLPSDDCIGPLWVSKSWRRP